MKIRIIGALLALVAFNINSNGQGFTSPALQWNIPAILDTSEYQVSYSIHQVIDMNGDGKLDLVDSENEATEGTADVFLNGNQKFWKVYLNTGSGFSATAAQWNIPAILDSNEFQISQSIHQVIDMNGDGKPDLIDSENEATEGTCDVFYNGNQKYWKVYLNTGSGFSATATQWNIPAVLDSTDCQIFTTIHQLIDMNGDGKPDMVDSENEATEGTCDLFFNGSQKYWKVYLNTGFGFDPTAMQWNMPAVLDTTECQIAVTIHQLIDMNGDGKPDLVDSENEATEGTCDVFFSGNQKYWKVYLNTGSGFTATASQWNMPAVLDTTECQISTTIHQVIDMNGDRKADLVDSENEATEGTCDVFFNGNQKYWKVYMNTGSGFNATAIQWNMPVVLDSNECQISQSVHQVIDFDGDRNLDLIDSENEATEGTADVFYNGNQKYWKVYLNNLPDLANISFGNQNNSLKVYPIPLRNMLNITFDQEISSITIYTMIGQVVLFKDLNAKEGTIDISNLNSGSYLVKVAAGTLVKTLKVIKE